MKPFALITGASSGIGLEFARLFAQENHPLILVSRSEEKLNGIARDLNSQYGIPVTVVAKDLTDPRAPEEIFQQLEAANQTVGVLVNNAAFGTCGMFTDTDWKVYAEMIQLNIASLTRLTSLFLPAMVQNRVGRVLNVASLGAFLPSPLAAVYFASKAYVLSFSQALANELQGTGVTVTCLCPGPTNTNFQKRAGMENTKVFQSNVLSASQVAKAGLCAMKRGKPLVLPGFRTALLAFITRFLPRKVLPLIMRNSLEQVRK